MQIVVQEYAPTGTTSMQEELYLQQGQIVSILSKVQYKLRIFVRSPPVVFLNKSSLGVLA